MLCIPAAALQARDVAEVVARVAAPEAGQGVAADAEFAYAVDNFTIAKYRIADGQRVTIWNGDQTLFPHINSCTLTTGKLICAASNYPQVPQLSTIEMFDAGTLEHVDSISLGMGPGSLTALNRHDGAWWAVFANYDGHGGEPARNHRYTVLARLDGDFQIARSWAFPDQVLTCIAPKSISGASWTADGKLLASGHDRPQIYVLSLPKAGSTLTFEGWFPIATHGQAIDIAADSPGLIWSINRPTREIFASQLPDAINSSSPDCGKDP